MHLNSLEKTQPFKLSAYFELKLHNFQVWILLSWLWCKSRTLKLANKFSCWMLVTDQNDIFLSCSEFLNTCDHWKWIKVFKNGRSKICGKQPLKNLKVLLHKFYLVHSQIPWPKWCYLFNPFHATSIFL